MANQSPPTALITGASSGLGYEFVKLFAKDHYDLVLVARNEARLQEIAEEIKQTYGTGRVTVVASDLSRPEAPDEIYQEVKRQGIEVSVLVNDAGFGEHGLFSENDLSTELAIIQVNISALVHLTKLYLRDMLARNEGKILQLASTVSLMPSPLMAVYGASKAFVLSFTEAVINEIKDSNVTMTALLPGATDTNFFRRAGAENTVVAQDTPLSEPADVAKDGYEALMKGESRVVSGVLNKIQAAASNVLPDGVIASGMRKLMEEKEDKSGQ